ncbi:MAG: RND transporter, partial [Gemmatimonadetes bacterium]|nr:RND transporter [Gemmatimonadota bacterium]
MKRLLVNLSSNHPKLVIAGALVITMLFASQLPKIHIDTDPENMLRADEPVRLFNHDVKETFALHDMVVLGIVAESGVFTPETLGRVARITEKIAAIEGVIDYDIYAPTEVDDIFTTGDGTLRVETLMGDIPEDRATAERVLAQIKKNPILRGKLASEDGQALAIFVPLEDKHLAHAVALEMERIVEEEGGDEEYHIAGIPIAESRFGAQMFVQ